MPVQRVLVFLGIVSVVVGLNNGLGRVPQMGWNSWNHFGCNVNENLIRQTIDTMVTSGLKAAGYEYVNIDDCWAGSRLSNGTIVPDTSTFPHGIKPLVDYAHSKGLKFGVYSDAGYKTCAGRPGSLGYEKEDAQSYASWGVDYLKYDNCNTDNSKPEVRYPVMRDALNATGRRIFFSMCEWGEDNPATWAAEVGNSWRTTGDISDQWESMISRADQNNKIWKYAAPGGWNDPDMLEVGNGKMTDIEYKSHFSLWCLMKAPLLVGCDITNMKNTTLFILTAPEVIAVNQDPMGIQGHKVIDDGEKEVWAGPLQDGSVAVVLFNRNHKEATIGVRWKDIGLNHDIKATVRDLWARKNLGSFRNMFQSQIDPHGVVMVKITPA